MHTKRSIVGDVNGEEWLHSVMEAALKMKFWSGEVLTELRKEDSERLVGLGRRPSVVCKF